MSSPTQPLQCSILPHVVFSCKLLTNRAKNDVVNIVRDLRARGLAIIVVSTEPETVLSLADRIVVLKRGAVVRVFANETVSKDRLLEAA